MRVLKALTNRWGINGGFALGLLLLSPGCTSPWWNAFLSPQEVGNFRENRVNEIQKSISFRDKPLGVPGASDPGPDDLVANVEEYKIGPGDTLSIRLLDFLQIGTESEFQPLVDELGFIDIAQLGWLKVEGMTPRQLQADLIQRGKAAGIYPADARPVIVVNILGRQQRSYNVSGPITAPGPYPIVRPDFRLREAINQAGGLADAVRTIYVFRDQPQAKRVHSPSPAAPTNGAAAAPPVSPSMAELWTSGGGAPGSPRKNPTVAAVDEAEEDLRNALAPGIGRSPAPAGTTTPVPAPAAQAPPATSPAANIPNYIYVNNEFVPAPNASAPAQPAPAAPAPAPVPSKVEPTPVPSPTSDAVDWNELATEGQQRIIRIAADKLRNGDPAANIVIRHQDWIQLDAGEVGVFYLMGHVLRPGVYQLTGQDMTLTQALAAAGGLDQLAWPSRCEIRRRLDGEREETTQWDLSRIVAGQDPDLYIKKDDVINVGTHAVAPLLATIRNSFRLTYGFGFVYDRNFADIDAVFAQQNPIDVRRSERAARGLWP